MGMSSTRAGLRTKKATPVRPSWTRPQAETTVQSIESLGPHIGILTQGDRGPGLTKPAGHFYSETSGEFIEIPSETHKNICRLTSWSHESCYAMP